LRLFERYFNHLKKTGKIPPAAIYDGGNYSITGSNQAFVYYKIRVTEHESAQYHWETVTIDMDDFKPFKRDNDLKNVLSG